MCCWNKKIKSCGKNGLIVKTGKKDLKNIIQQMNQLIFHRGPDDSGIWINEKIGMVMHRLSIIDLKSGQQPMRNPSNNSSIVFNGSIENRGFPMKATFNFERPCFL